MTVGKQRFFVSYAGPDRAWAEWTGWHLEQAGHTVELDRWDWATGDDFVGRMDHALAHADAVVALFSQNYFGPGRWTQAEWKATVAGKGRLVPLAIKSLADEDVPPLLRGLIRKELHGLDENEAVAALLEAVDGPSRPVESVAYPGADDTGPDAAPDGARPRLPRDDDRPEVWNVARRNLDFSGREAEITRLRVGFLGGRQAAVQALHGMGGIGKTQIALEYAYRFASQYDLVWWIDAEQADQIPVHFTELADRLGIAKPDAGTEYNARILLQHLRTRHRWLVILDNAEHPDQIEPWTPDGTGHTLITSRDPNWRGLAHQTGLDVFTRTDSLAYLEARLPSISADEAGVLAEAVGDLPLALAQAAGVIGSGMTLDRYCRLLATSTARILQEGDAPGYPASLAAAVDIATTRLTDEHAESGALLRLGAFLGPEPIPNAWLENARPRLATIPGDPDDLMWLHSALQPLGRYGLARIDHQVFQIHRLTQAVIRDQTSPEQAGMIRDDIAAVLACVDPGDPDTPETWSAWASAASHLTAPHAVVADRPELRPMLLQAALFLIRSGQARGAHGLALSLQQAWGAELGEDHPDTLTAMQYLGHATADIGDVAEARRVVEDTLARRRHTLGSDDPQTLQSANDLAVILDQLGISVHTREMYEDTLARRRRVLGDDHPDTLQSALNLGLALLEYGKLEEARRLVEDALVRRRRALGDDHPQSLEAAAGLASVLYECGDYAEAHRMHADTLAHQRRALGDDHPQTLQSVQSLAAALMQVGKYEGARPLLEDALARRRRTFGDDHPETIECARRYASALSHVGEQPEAHRMLEDVLARCRRNFGDDHGRTIRSVNALAVFLYEAGEYVQARRLLEDAHARARRILGDERIETLRIAESLGLTLYRLRCYPESVAILEDTRARQRRLLGDGHVDTVHTTQSLARTYTAMGKRFAAQRLLSPKKQGKRRFGRKSR
ncbi:tetratricopeptide (TPR) repeat protein [Streptomyces olivoverticillatus]|uniref:Tetratricopeptide (TPR) repeat protein n=1 Tax=Streptomyces olivoverticillatus TaxID=66427 RepID=A0A7W7PLH9_9ACTN|nr:tetratricopeptide (TPR) repeat protein [Streptomyces olivoverticillatus]